MLLRPMGHFREHPAINLKVQHCAPQPQTARGQLTRPRAGAGRDFVAPGRGSVPGGGGMIISTVRSEGRGVSD